VHLSVTEALSEGFYDGPAILEGLQLGGCAQILKKSPAFAQVLEAEDGSVQFIFRCHFLARTQ
jgi:hypothetical protein